MAASTPDSSSDQVSNGATPGSGPRKATSMFNSVKRELHQLAHPYYIVNLILGLAFLCLRLIPPVCYYVFGNSGGKQLNISLIKINYCCFPISSRKHAWC